MNQKGRAILTILKEEASAKPRHVLDIYKLTTRTNNDIQMTDMIRALKAGMQAGQVVCGPEGFFKHTGKITDSKGMCIKKTTAKMCQKKKVKKSANVCKKKKKVKDEGCCATVRKYTRRSGVGKKKGKCENVKKHTRFVPKRKKNKAKKVQFCKPAKKVCKRKAAPPTPECSSPKQTEEKAPEVVRPELC